MRRHRQIQHVRVAQADAIRTARGRMGGRQQQAKALQGLGNDLVEWLSGIRVLYFDVAHILENPIWG